jgi:ureidoglycolate lyase
MRYVRFLDPARPDSAPATGVLLDGERVADLSHPACADLLAGTPPTLQAFIEQGLAGITRHLAGARFADAAVRPLAGLRLLSPVQPGKVVGAAFNFTDALAERGMAHPAEPVIFVRSGRTVVGPDEPIEVPPDVGNVGYEAELAAVIGRPLLAVSAEQALDGIAGYVAHNDVSGSALVKADGGNFVRGKNLPASAPLGPWLVTPDELGDPHQVGIRLDVDGRPLQDGNTRTLLFGFAALIAYVSQRMPLDPGDVIAAGTPAGVAAMHRPEAWLQPGQTVTVEVQGCGRLRNPVVAGPPFLGARGGMR